MRKCSLVFYFLVLLGTSLVITSCEKDEFAVEQKGPDTGQVTNGDPLEKPGAVFLQVGKEEAKIRLRAAIEELTELSKIVLQDEDARTELYFLFQNEYYGDYYVGLYDVMHLEESELYQKTFVPLHVLGSLRSRITSILQKDSKSQFGNLSFYLHTDPETLRDFTDYYQEAGLYFYCPYCPDYVVSEFNPTLVPATIDADQAPGYAVSGRGEYRIVMVDDDYATKNPTVIITGEKKGGVEAVPAPKNPPTPPGPLCPDSIIRQVFLGHVLLKDHFEKSISFTGNGGKSELKIVRVHGALDVSNSGDINELDGKDIITVNVRRRDVRKKKWLWIDGAMWDSNWSCEDIEQMIGFYEEDNEGKFRFKGSIKYLAKIDTVINSGIELLLGVDIERTSKDEAIHQQTREFFEFFVTNQISNQTDGLKEGEGIFEDQEFTIYNGGEVEYTLPHRFIE